MRISKQINQTPERGKGPGRQNKAKPGRSEESATQYRKSQQTP